MDYLINLPNILLYYGSAILIFLIFIGIYTIITPYRELIEIRSNRNAAAAVALSGSMIGFSLPVASLIAHSANLINFFAWSTVASVVQIVTFCMRPALPSSAISALAFQ
jgi:putative membrane protein